MLRSAHVCLRLSAFKRNFIPPALFLRAPIFFLQGRAWLDRALDAVALSRICMGNGGYSTAWILARDKIDCGSFLCGDLGLWPSPKGLGAGIIEIGCLDAYLRLKKRPKAVATLLGAFWMLSKRPHPPPSPHYITISQYKHNNVSDSC